MSQYAIAIQSLPQHTTAALRSMLTLLDPALGARWRVVGGTGADVVLLPEDAFAQMEPGRPPDSVPLLLALTNAEQRPTQAYATLRRPVTPARLVEALNQAEALLVRASFRADALSTLPLLQRIDAQQRLNPATLDTRVRTSMRAATFRLLQDPVAATLINEERDALFTVLPGLGFSSRLTPAEFVKMFRLNPSAILIELSPAEQAALSNAREFRSLRELEWTFWITSRSPWLRPELNETTRYRLRRWPDFGRLPHYQADVRMASFLVSHPLALAELQERIGVRPETAMNFLNATFGMGLLMDASHAPPPPRIAPAAAPAVGGLGALIAQLRRKFGRARAAS